MTYIYLNKYENGSMYVGSHTWDGEGIDPSYKGSSRIAKNHGWTPIEIVILEDVTNQSLHDRLVAEHDWIIRYMDRFGAHYLVKEYNHYQWYERWKSGVMLNCHANLGVDKSYTKESQAKRVQFYKDKGQSVADRLHQPGMSKKAAAHHNYKEVSAKRAEKMKGRKKVFITCKCLGIEGSVNSVCAKICQANWQTCIQRHLLIQDVYEREGYVFKVISKIVK